MLTDARLGVAAAILGIVGLLSIYFFENLEAARVAEINQLKYAKQGELVRFSGVISKITMKEGGATLQVCSAGDCANVYVPSSEQNPYLFEKGQNAVVTARVEQLYGNNVMRLRKISVSGE